ncbi:MAG: hypothetical protein H0W63_02815 [Gemmatimonadaceae bacterium]|nr:hypothetical protein [Gemmatimonadaceae bacterium]
MPRALAYAFAFLHLLVTALSSFPPGALPITSFRFHKVVELIGGFFLVGLPWMLGFADRVAARNSFMIMGAVLLLLAAFTDFERRRMAVPPPPGDRRRKHMRRSG